MQGFCNCLTGCQLGSCLTCTLLQVATAPVLADFSDGCTALDQCFLRTPPIPVGAAEGCDLLILLLILKKQSQKIAAFGSSYRGGCVFRGQKKRPEPVGASVLRLCG
ncbi:hypothetical protein EMIT0P395_10095 [Pseudomonas sp. IT-P395]